MVKMVIMNVSNDDDSLFSPCVGETLAINQLIHVALQLFGITEMHLRLC